MSKTLLSLAANFKIDNRIVPWDELLGSDIFMNELTHQLSRSGWPARTFEEIRKELLRLHGRWKKVQHKSASFQRAAVEDTWLWSQDSEDEDDLFMPSTKAKRPASSKSKTTTSSKGKSVASTVDDDDDFMPSTKAKRPASSKSKTTASSKGKSAASTKDDDDDFM
jgi:hypothetical protein